MLDQLSLFDYESSSMSFEDLIVRDYPNIQICLSKRMRNSWRIDWMVGQSLGRITAPAILELAPAYVKRALLDWAELMKKRKSNKLEYKLAKKKTERIVWEYLHDPLNDKFGSKDNLDREGKIILAHAKNKNLKKINGLQAEGKAHNLNEIFDHINNDYFNNKLKARLTWSSRVGGLSTHVIEQDSNGDQYHLISISQGYDFPDVSLDIVGGVVYHECLHIDIPPFYRDGRRIVHGSEFKRREKQYKFYNEWISWHNTQLVKKLKTLRWRRSMEKWKKKIFLKP